MEPITIGAIELWDPYTEESNDVGYQLFLMYEESRGDLAFHPDTLECYECGGFDGHTAPLRKVMANKGTVNVGGYYPTGEPVDPYDSYLLECGHTAIAF